MGKYDTFIKLFIHNTESDNYHWFTENKMDGVSGVTQCPQQPGTTFTYQFTVNNQFGTFCEIQFIRFQELKSLICSLKMQAQN
jgi:hypothetical protein